jgi:hypothetical protein
VRSAQELVSDDEVYLPSVHVPHTRQPSTWFDHQTLVDRDDEVLIPRSTQRPVFEACASENAAGAQTVLVKLPFRTSSCCNLLGSDYTL